MGRVARANTDSNANTRRLNHPKDLHMDRAEIQERIAQLDREINLEVGRHKLPSTNTRYRSFPVGSWIGALVLLALWVYGGTLPFVKTYYDTYSWVPYVLLAVGGLCALSALWYTFMWMFKARAKVDAKYMEGMQQVTKLQDERKALQKQLNELKKK
jgi:hypothetical protein